MSSPFQRTPPNTKAKTVLIVQLGSLSPQTFAQVTFAVSFSGEVLAPGQVGAANATPVDRETIVTGTSITRDNMLHHFSTCDIKPQAIFVGQ